MPAEKVSPYAAQVELITKMLAIEARKMSQEDRVCFYRYAMLKSLCEVFEGGVLSFHDDDRFQQRYIKVVRAQVRLFVDTKKGREKDLLLLLVKTLVAHTHCENLLLEEARRTPVQQAA